MIRKALYIICITAIASCGTTRNKVETTAQAGTTVDSAAEAVPTVKAVDTEGSFWGKLLGEACRVVDKENICLSPLSAQFAMAMVANGAEGKTRKEILDVMQLGDSANANSRKFLDDIAIKAQLGTPDMRLPIMYALTYPVRLSSSFERIDWNTLKELTFEKPNLELFPNLRHAYTALSEGGNIPCVVNAANEICVAAFLEERIKFTDMPKLIERAMEKATYILKPTLDDYLETDKEIRAMVKEWI